MQQPEHGPAYVVTVIDIGECGAEFTGHRVVHLVCHQLDRTVEGMTGPQRALDHIDGIRQLFLKLLNAFPAIAI